MSDRSEALTPSPSALPLWQRYRAIRLLGQSQFCRTDLALDANSNLCVVKQFLLPEPPDFDELEALEHPQLPRLLDRSEQVLVYKFIEGDSLATGDRFDEVRIRKLLLNLLPILQAIHRQGWIHGDIKPENILFSKGEALPVLVDLNNGVVASNAGYAAPEAIAGLPEAASDLFSLGLSCAHLLTGVPPFELRDAAPSAQSDCGWQQYLSEPISPTLERILDRLLQTDPRRRYQTAESVLRDLRSNPIRAGQAIVKRSPALRNVNDIVPRQTWHCRQILDGHSGEVTALAVSPDGYFFASGSSDRSLKLWDVASGQLVQTFAGRSLWSAGGHRGRINALTFSPEGNLLISGSDDGTIKLWDLASQKLMQTIDGLDWGVDALAIAPDAPILASGGGEGAVSLWDLDATKLIFSLGKHRDRVTTLAFNPSATLLASGSSDGTIRLWNFDRSAPLQTLSGHSASVRAIVFWGDRTLISGSEDKTLKFWQVDSLHESERGELLTTVAAHKDAVTALAIAPEEIDRSAPLLASASADHTIKLWDLTAQRRVATLRHDWSVNAIAFTPTGLLISGSSDETIRIWQQD